MEKFIYKKLAGTTVLSASIEDFRYKKHSHKEYALGVTLRGIQEYNVSREFQASHKNGVMLFNPEQIHDGGAHDKTGIDYVMVYIEPEHFMELCEMKETVKFCMPVIYDSFLQNQIQNLTKIVIGQKEEILCEEMLISLMDYLKPTLVEKYEKYSKDKIFGMKAKEIIEKDLHQVLKIDGLSQALGVSKYQCIRLFKASVGISPYQYFLNAKIQKAKEILEKTKDSYCVVEELGFVDLTHLNRHFKSVYGTTPQEYLAHVM